MSSNALAIHKIRLPSRRGVILMTLALVIVLIGMAAYVLIPVAGDLRAARASLTGRGSIGSEEVDDALVRLRRASDRLDSPAARLLGPVPVFGHNVRALRAVTSDGVGVLATGSTLLDQVDGLTEVGSGRSLVQEVEALAAQTSLTVDRLTDLDATIDEYRSGWLMPSLWYSLEPIARETTKILGSLTKAESVLGVAPALLGAEGKRQYLIVLMNNAELRGAGGIPSGIGVLNVEDGRTRFGRFYYYSELTKMRRKIVRVRAPEEFAERFGRWDAHTSYLVNSTMSPDVPEVAEVLTDLYAEITGVAVDGVFFADPHGLAAMLPKGRSVKVPGTASTIDDDDLIEFIYSRSYEQFQDANASRRAGILLAGKALFDDLEVADLLGETQRIGEAISGQHLRLVPSSADESEALMAAGVTGDLETQATDPVFVSVQNYGGDKLDYWAQRTVSHDCVVGSLVVSCRTGVAIANGAPKDLPSYVTQGRDRASLKSFTEIYLPASAQVRDVRVDGRTVPYSMQQEDGLHAVGRLLRIPRGETAEMQVAFTIPPRSSFSAVITPQPLAREASLSVRIEIPEAWEFGQRSAPGNVFEYHGPFSRSLTIDAGPPVRPSGLTRLWEGIVHFWNNPIGS